MEFTPRERVPDAVMGCLEACRRCKEVVAAVIDQDPASFPAVGSHLRHCVDHFRLLLEGFSSGSIDYDARSRDPRLERDPWATCDALDAIAGAAGVDVPSRLADAYSTEAHRESLAFLS